MIIPFLPVLNAKPAKQIPLTQVLKQLQEGNEQPIIDICNEWTWDKLNFNRDQEITYCCGDFQRYINIYREEGKDVNRFEKIFNEHLGFFIYSPRYLFMLTSKMRDYFERGVNIDTFFLDLGRDISAVKLHADYAFLKEETKSHEKLQIFREYKMYCVKNCFMTKNKLWDGFICENEKTLEQLKLKSQKTFERAFDRWNEGIDFNEFKQKIQILNMEWNKSLAYGS